MIVGAQISSVNIIVGNAIRFHRLARGVSMADIARCLNKPENYVWLVEAGSQRPSPIELSDIAVLLQCRLSEFFFEAFNDASMRFHNGAVEPP